MSDSIGEQWRNAFWANVQEYETAERLREAAINERLSVWTQELTSVVVATCRSVGWHASAKRNLFERLPVRRQEYLAIDVMAFTESKSRWTFPVAVFELENKRSDDVIAYSLWKVLCVRTALRVVFCYRRNVEQHAPLMRYLSDEVIKSLGVETCFKLEGQTLVVVGSRDDSSKFPYGFFKWWELDKNTAKFGQFR